MNQSLEDPTGPNTPVVDSPASTPPPRSVSGSPISRRWVMSAFVILFAMNLLDYLDRNVLYAVMPQVKESMEITNAQAGMLPACFLVSYSIFGLCTGYLGDRMRRTTLLALGVGIWSLATVASGLARGYYQLAAARVFLGIGEATYGVIAPTLLLDLFPRHQRARALSGFYLAMPIGSALGIALGGIIAKHYDWHWAFFLVGFPGLVAAFAAFLLPEPVRGTSEGVDESGLLAHSNVKATWPEYKDLSVNSSYCYAVLGMTAYTFAIGGMLVWVPTYLVSTRGFPQDKASTALGLVTLFAALLGMSLGGWISDSLGKRNARALFTVPGLAMLASVPFILGGLLSRQPVAIFGCIFLAEMLMFVNTGPCNAVIGNVVAPNLRAAAYAIAILFFHFLGDIWSPWLIGIVADYSGKADFMLTGAGQFLDFLGAVPTIPANSDKPENLVAGLLIVVPAVVLSGLVLLAGARHLPSDIARMLSRLKAAARGQKPPIAASDSTEMAV